MGKTKFLNYKRENRRRENRRIVFSFIIFAVVTVVMIWVDNLIDNSEDLEGSEMRVEEKVLTCGNGIDCDNVITCENGVECNLSEYIDCVDNKCIECDYDTDCPDYEFPIGEECINHHCYPHKDISEKACEKIAVIDFGMKNPYCEYDSHYDSYSDFEDCECREKIIKSSRKEILRNESVIVIPEVVVWGEEKSFDILNKTKWMEEEK